MFGIASSRQAKQPPDALALCHAYAYMQVAGHRAANHTLRPATRLVWAA
jgi:hypothetical protein